MSASFRALSAVAHAAQVPHRPVGDVRAVRGEGDRVGLGGGTERAAGQVAQGAYASTLRLLVLMIVRQQMTLLEAQTLTLRILKQVMEEKLDQNNVQVAQVRSIVQNYAFWMLTNVSSGNTREGLRDSGQCGFAGGDRCHVNALSLHR